MEKVIAINKKEKLDKYKMFDSYLLVNKNFSSFHEYGLSNKDCINLVSKIHENKKKVYHRDKKRYVFNPLSLIWSKDNYYLLCYDDRHDGTSRYRIDKMEDVTVEAEPILEKEEFNNFDSETYRKQIFSMFGGELEEVTIQFDKELLSDIYDKFGTDIEIQRKYGGALETTLSVQVSKTFFLWIVGTLGKVKIIEPNNVNERFDSFVKEITDNY